MIPGSHRRGFTLIEQLIVIAIVAIIVNAVFLVWLVTRRVERAVVAQQDSLSEVVSLVQAWRDDVHRATSVQPASDTAASTGTVVLALADGAQVVYTAASNASGKWRVDRVRRGPEGKASTQLMAGALDAVEFADGPTSGLLQISLSVNSGFDVQWARQELVALARVGGER